ncbi:MAG: hypothetical protein IJJ47_08540 [Methanosphaera sp.]|nr:hypothetical protein [Methanosphaera sp.]
MRQIAYNIVVFLHLMGYSDNSKIKLLTNMYQKNLEIENSALVEIVKNIIDDLKDKNVNTSIISNLEAYVEEIQYEMTY